MGMFDSYAKFGDKFTVGDRFVLVDAEYSGKIKTVHGDADMSILTIATRDEQKKVRYQALGVGIGRQAKDAEPGDFPVVVELVKVPTGNEGNEVKLFAPIVGHNPRAYLDGDDGPAVDLDSLVGSAESAGVKASDALEF